MGKDPFFCSDSERETYLEADGLTCLMQYTISIERSLMGLGKVPVLQKNLRIRIFNIKNRYYNILLFLSSCPYSLDKKNDVSLQQLMKSNLPTCKSNRFRVHKQRSVRKKALDLFLRPSLVTTPPNLRKHLG